MLAALFRRLTPTARVRLASGLLDIAVVGWPLTSLTVFASSTPPEQGILGLSWLALILTCVDIVTSTDVRDQL